MTNREMLMEIKKAALLMEQVKDIAHEIVENTFDRHCSSIDDVAVEDTTVKIWYEYECRGEYFNSSVRVPIEWFDEGFDYRAAYKEMRQKEVEEEKKKKKKKIAEAKKEYETYLKLKEKYETCPKSKNGKKNS